MGAALGRRRRRRARALRAERSPPLSPGARHLATVGVYGFSAASFLAALRREDVSLVIDVRQRRGVRGSDYAWANARRLVAALEVAGLDYRHHRELAPTTELRRLQYAEDDRQGVGKRSRVALAPAYHERYVAGILDRAALRAIELTSAGVAALLCVERDPEACHRSLVAERLAAERGLEVHHIKPAEDGAGDQGSTR